MKYYPLCHVSYVNSWGAHLFTYFINLRQVTKDHIPSFYNCRYWKNITDIDVIITQNCSLSQSNIFYVAWYAPYLQHNLLSHWCKTTFFLHSIFSAETIFSFYFLSLSLFLSLSSLTLSFVVTLSLPQEPCVPATPQHRSCYYHR